MNEQDLSLADSAINLVVGTSGLLNKEERSALAAKLNDKATSFCKGLCEDLQSPVFLAMITGVVETIDAILAAQNKQN